MKKNKLDVFLSEGQLEFYNSEALYTLYAGGLGSGKTHAGAFWAIMMALKYPKVVGLITANSHSQLRKATLSKVFELLELYGIKYTYKNQEGILQIGDAKIYTISMERYDLLRGIEAGWAWSDECAFYKKEAYQVLIGRIRDARATCQWKGTTTPNGFNWLYNLFVEEPPPSSKVIYGRTRDNMAHLGSNYIATLKQQYDSRLIEQELEGRFVNLNAGLVYYAFDRRKNCGEINSAGRPIFVGLDFNVHPLCGVFVVQDRGKVYVTDEIRLENSNTFQAAQEIVKRYPYQTLNVVPDETGNRRRSSSSATDHEILRRANLNVVGFKNPGVKDRYNNLNRLLDHGKLIISPNCQWTVRDLEKMTHDSKDPLLGHITDALGYVCWHLDPMKRPKPKPKVSYR